MGEKSEIAAPPVMPDPDAAAAPVAPLPRSSAGKRKPRAKPNHPKTAEMVNAAITAMNDRHGSSLLAIKKYIGITYGLDTDKHAPFIKKYLRAALTSGVLLRTKGQSLAGSFKLARAKPRSSSIKRRTRSAVAKPRSSKKSVDKPTGAPRSAGAKKTGTKKGRPVDGGRKIIKKGKPSRREWRLVKVPAAKSPKVKLAKAKVVAAKSPPRKPAATKKGPLTGVKSGRVVSKKAINVGKE